MCRVIIGFVVVCVALNFARSDPGIIPSKEEQANLLRNVEEVFNQVKSLVNDEGDATDAAVVGDVERMTARASQHLSLLQDFALLKVTCDRKSPLEPKIREAIREGRAFLDECVVMASEDIMNNSQTVSSLTDEAMSQGQTLLDTLNRCSSRPGLQQITCYKKVIAHDVFPLKLILLEAIRMHKAGHLRAISIRKKANECVDYVLSTYRAKIAQVLARKGSKSN